MNRQNHNKLRLGALSLILILSLIACTSTETPNEATQTQGQLPPTTMEATPVEETEANDFTIVDEDGKTDIDTDALAEELPHQTDSSELSDLEIQGLLFMREEEKLARDVYLTLGEMWNMNIFENIARSEQTHTDAIKVLLDQFGLEDPMATDEVGVFENEKLQTMYDDLVAAGSQSLIEALKVGAAIEEIDIIDLEEYSVQTDNADIQLVYANLTKGSRNHLRSFVSVLEKQSGESYQPQYLTQEAFNTIINSAMENSGNGRGNSGGNGHGNGGNN